MLAGYLVSIVPHSDMYPGAVKTKIVLWLIQSNWLANMAGTAIDASRHSCEKLVGLSVMDGLNACGSVRGLKYHPNNQSVEGFGSMMARAFGYEHSM